MTFLRTNDGLTNRALFSDVDIVIYTEGGRQSYSVSDVDAGKHNEHSLDEEFWDRIFQKHSLKSEYKLLPVGSKKTVKSIAERVLAKKVKFSGVAMDTDFDELDNRKINSPYVLYTYGYSWESDVFELTLLEQFITDYSPTDELSTTLIKEARVVIDNYFDGCTKLTVYNVCYLEKSMKKLSYRKFETKNAFGIMLDVSSIEKLLSAGNNKQGTLSKGLYKPVREYRRFIPGKWVKEFFKDVVIRLRKKGLHYQKESPNDDLQGKMIDMYMKSTAVSSYQFYEEQVRRLDGTLLSVD